MHIYGLNIHRSKRMSSKFGVWTFLGFSEILVPGLNRLILDCRSIGFQPHWGDWWCLRKASTQLRAGIHWKLEICKLQISSSLFRPHTYGDNLLSMFGLATENLNYPIDYLRLLKSLELAFDNKINNNHPKKRKIGTLCIKWYS